MNILYTAVATAENGRDGRVHTDDGKLDVAVSPPKELGGSGSGTNPEQLFAAGYSACFHSVLCSAARRENIDATGSRVTARVGIGKDAAGGFGLRVALEIHLPHADHDTARRLVERAHQTCPYSHATRGNIDVDLLLTTPTP